MDGTDKACHGIESLLADVDTRLADGRNSLLGGVVLNYTDFAFAAMSGLWLQPASYGGDQAEPVRLESARLPKEMRADVERWEGDYPHAVSWVERLYREERARRFKV